MLITNQSKLNAGFTRDISFGCCLWRHGHADGRSYDTGFTLLEAIIYVALFSLILSGILLSVYQVIDSSVRTRQDFIREEEGNFLLRKISWALSGTDVIQDPLPGTSGPSLRVLRYDSSNPIMFDLDSGAIRIVQGSNPPIVLSGSSVTVSDLVFEHIAPVGGESHGVKASFKLNGKEFEMTKYVKK